ncbi:Rha family transcriptional regulator [Pseudomonas syringae]|uniref:BRO-N domain-containing protein n=1 Tax=Pseudomonas syringae group TaxID=136849 RepID=UPI000C078C57|nr:MULTISPECIES: Bro-N domain-containing protein [Pseudomonas syringae group]PHN54794.1 Rha family transcriptional regulator [Pseudomonas syringae]
MNITPFQFNSTRVRIVTDEKGVPMFVGRDACEILGYANPNDAMARHCRGVVKRYPIIDSLGRKQEARVLSEPDVLRLIVSSQLPAAQEFERWVFEEALPTIRMTGKYEMPIQPAANGTKVIGELAIMECFTRLLKPAPSSQMMMLTKIAQNNGLDPQFLPGYAIDSAPDATGGSSMPTKSVTALIKDNGIACTAPVFNLALERHGFLKIMTRKNSKQQVVEFWSVTDKGLAYGKNLTSPQSPRETQPHWYVDRFLELAGLVGKGRP